MRRKIYDVTDNDFISLRTGTTESVLPGHVSIACFYDSVEIDRPKARELAAILTHFADAGELPNDEGGGA